LPVCYVAYTVRALRDAPLEEAVEPRPGIEMLRREMLPREANEQRVPPPDGAHLGGREPRQGRHHPAEVPVRREAESSGRRCDRHGAVGEDLGDGDDPEPTEVREGRVEPAPTETGLERAAREAARLIGPSGR